jgi:hypothetical protein
MYLKFDIILNYGLEKKFLIYVFKINNVPMVLKKYCYNLTRTQCFSDFCRNYVRR